MFGGQFPPNQAIEAKNVSISRDPFMSRYNHVKLVSELQNEFPHLVVSIVCLLLNKSELRLNLVKDKAISLDQRLFLTKRLSKLTILESSSAKRTTTQVYATTSTISKSRSAMLTLNKMLPDFCSFVSTIEFHKYQKTNSIARKAVGYHFGLPLVHCKSCSIDVTVLTIAM